MEPEDSLLCLQDSNTGRWPEPDKYSSLLILSFHLRLIIPSALIPSGFLTTIL
jgi:hypothetical protein